MCYVLFPFFTAFFTFNWFVWPFRCCAARAPESRKFLLDRRLTAILSLRAGRRAVLAHA